MTVMSYYGMPANNTDMEEERIAREMNPTVSEKTGINPGQLAAWFTRQGWNATWDTGGSRDMLRNNLKAFPRLLNGWTGEGTGWLLSGTIHGARRMSGTT